MKLITYKELMKRLDIKSRSTVYRWVKKGCPCVGGMNRFIRFEFNDVLEWLKTNKG